MPNYKGHLLGGCITGIIALGIMKQEQTTITTALELLGCCLLGSLFPDIDIKSKGQKIFYRLIGAILCFLLLQKKLIMGAFVGLVSTIPLLVRHRGIFHNPFFIIAGAGAFIIIVNQTNSPYAVGLSWDIVFFTLGALSHVALDRGIVRILF
jgi:hypothetical protein